jgi:hypothetical protein
MHRADGDALFVAVVAWGMAVAQWHWCLSIEEISAVRMVLNSLCGCGCGGGWVAVDIDLIFRKKKPSPNF